MGVAFHTARTGIPAAAVYHAIERCYLEVIFHVTTEGIHRTVVAGDGGNGCR
jgi:hypothetical protein